jgi:hypothetical protein
MANITTNVDVDYVTKDYSSVVDAVINFATVNFGSSSNTSANRLWTNFNADSFSRNWLEIVAFVSDIFFFYFDNQATQSYLQTATVRSAIKNIAKQFGFVPASATSASGVAQLEINAAGTVSRGFKLQASNGAIFFTTNNLVATVPGTYSVNVIQGEIANETFSAVGLQNEELDLAGPNVIRDLTNLNPQDISPQVTVNGNSYTLVDSLIRFNGTDTPAVLDSLGNVIGGGGRVFTLEERPNGTPFIRFGDGIFGRKIQPGETIQVTYRTGGGTQGNIPEQSLTTTLDTNVIVSSVSNATQFSGGADEQSIEQLRQLIPASLRTLDRAVAEQDYSDILVATFPEVFAASTEPNTTDPGVDLNVYVVPQGAGITNISDNILLRDRLTRFLDRRKTVTVQFQIQDAFGIDALISLEVFINDTASRSTVTSAIQTALANYFSLTDGGPEGSGIGFSEDILLKDINNIVQQISGIERFEIKRLTYRPRVESRSIGLLTQYNTSEVSIYRNVEEKEWLAAASGTESTVGGETIFLNESLIGFSYDSITGEVAYDFPVSLNGVSPGDRFIDGAGNDFAILAVDTVNSTLIIPEGATVNDVVTLNTHGSIESGQIAFEGYTVFKKILANATNLSSNSITDNNLDLSVLVSEGNAINARTILDNAQVFIPGEYSTGEFFLVDAASNIWEILSNDSNTIFTSITAVNDASVSSLTSGEYKIVRKLTGQQVIFQNSIFNIQYNSDNTLFSIGGLFNQIGTIGDSFQISFKQNNLGKLGVPLDIISFSDSSGVIRLNGSPQLNGISTEDVIIDNEGQIFNIVSVDNIAKPSVQYLETNLNNSVELEDSGLGSQYAQGFQVNDDDTYAVASFFLKREGNVIGNLTARIVADDGSGLPDISNTIEVSEPVQVTSIPKDNFYKVFFSFETPPVLSSSTQYHVILAADAGYASSKQSGVVSFSNSGLVEFNYNSASGVITFDSAVNLSSVEPGHFFVDSSGNLFPILAVSDSDDTINIASGETVDDSAPTVASEGSVVVNDRILVGIDSSSPTYPNGELSQFDGLSQWSNSTDGPSAGDFTDVDGNTFTEGDAIFTIEGTKTLTIDSNLTPNLGRGATVSRRYYDDENQVSFVIGASAGVITSATDVNAIGIGTVASVPNRPVDTFTFRTSRFVDDVINVRKNEIPQLDPSDIQIQIFGGVQ